MCFESRIFYTVRSKYCFRAEDLSSAVFWFDNMYLRTTTEHPEAFRALYVMWVQKRKWANLRDLRGQKPGLRVKKFLQKASYATAREQPTFFIVFLSISKYSRTDLKV